MKNTLLLAGAALLGLAATLPEGLARADGTALRPNVMGVSEIKPGMKGYGLTVFEGTKPTRFDVEVIGVLKNFRPRQEVILIKTFHPRLEVAKVVAGMSGSPIFIDGKMIGAYAYGWTFGSEPIAGVTPIRTMLDELALPLPDTINGWPLKLVPGQKVAQKPAAGASEGRSRFHGELGRYDVREHAAEVARTSYESSPTPVRPVATPLLVGGLTPSAIRLASELLSPLGLEPLQAGGGGSAPEPDAPQKFEDGGAIGVELIRGDMSATGLGTVTRVEGDKLVAFGHPMMEAGNTALPTAIGKVLWVLASEQRSFKIGMPVRSMGALVNDRVASIVVSQSAKAPVIPVKMAIKGVPGVPLSSWSFEVAHERFLTPSFLSVALGSGLQTVASEQQDVSWTATSKLKIKDYGEITLRDFGVAIGGTPDAGEFARSNLVRAVGAILNNPWQSARVESVQMDVELHYGRELYRLRGAELLSSELDAGEPAKIRLTMVPFSGPVVQKVVSVPLPAHLAGRTLTLEISPGYVEEKDKASPDTLRDLVHNFEDPIQPPKSVVVSYASPEATVTHKGRIATDLPMGAIDALRPSTSSIAPDAYTTTVRQSFPLNQYLVGRDRVNVTIRPVVR
ncbi:MAG TPA: SpoIVB peptidase S55 domain-containing protein [Polyangiaceae bacterium]|nr:SpoIVB peptidase S55 domain-containing protein [Polyangiaceae bacterium]